MAGKAKLQFAIPGYPADGAPFALMLQGSSFRVSAEDLSNPEWTDHDALAKGAATRKYSSMYNVKVDRLSVRAAQ
jgi:hypothetical protein